MRLPSRTLVLLLGVGACADGVGPAGPDALRVQFAIGAPAAVSAEETAALQAAFDLVDSYEILVRDSVSGSTIVADTLPVESGQLQHSFDFTLPPSSIGLRVVVSVVGFDGGTELYRAAAVTTIQAVSGSGTPVVLSVRYTGPGVRGTVADDAGVGLADVGVGLYRGADLIESAATEPDGTYLFLNVPSGSYTVEPTPPGDLFMCPATRSIGLQPGDALVADFVASTLPCQIDVLVLSGGDVDDTQVVADLFANTPGATTSTFFYVDGTPGLTALRRYDVVLLFTNGIFNETTSLGTELSQYVQEGGNLVIGSFYWQGRSDSGFDSPGWGSLEQIDPFVSDVDPLTGQGGATYTANDLNPNNVVVHPLTTGLSTLTSIAGYSAGVTAKAGTSVVASWTDGAPLVGYRVLGAGQRIVAVSLSPPRTSRTRSRATSRFSGRTRSPGRGARGGRFPRRVIGKGRTSSLAAPPPWRSPSHRPRRP